MTETNAKIQQYFDQSAPNWDSHCSCNNKLIAEYVNLLNISSSDNVLDLACGTGVVTAKLVASQANSILAVDVSSKMIECAKAKLTDTKATFMRIDYLCSHILGYNKLIMYNALPHFMDRQVLAQKMHESLKKNAIALICHGSSRAKINSCHSGVSDISTPLLSVTDEYANFSPYFNLVSCRDDDEQYYMLLSNK